MRSENFEVRSGSEMRSNSRPFVSTFHFELLTGYFVLFCLLVMATPVCAEEKLPAEAPLDMRPYRVALRVAFDSPQLSAAAQQDILNETGFAAARCVGEMWSLDVEPAEWILPVSAVGLARVAPSQLIGRGARREDGAEAVDVWFAATVQDARPGCRVDVRAWQPEIQLATEAVGVHVADPRDVPLAILRLCGLSFRPTGIVDEVDGKTARVRLRAGGLVPPDESFAQVRPGDTFAPMIAARNREQRIERLQPIPWTYLSVTELAGSRIVCDIGSGLRSPIGGKQRGRIETLVVAVRPQQPATRLELATQTKPSLPLVAHRIELRSSPDIPRPDDDAARQEHLLGELLTDRRGLAIVARDTERPLVWLFAYSGKHLLARVPFVPGSVTEARLEVPDDAARLTTEADIQMLQGQLVDAVALRNTHFAAIRAEAKRNEFKRVREKLDEIPRLPDATLFLDRLAAIRVAGVNAAKSRRDRAAETRINRLCDDMATLVRQYLGDDKAKTLTEEMTDLIKSESGTADEVSEKDRGK